MSDQMSTDALELFCRNRAKASGKLTEYDRALLVDVSDRLCALQAENGSKDREIERLQAKVKQWRQTSEENFASCEKLQAALSRVEAERDAAIKDSVVRCCGTCNAHTRGAYNGKCMVCALCECVPENFREYHKTHYSKSLWEWRGAQGEG